MNSTVPVGGERERDGVREGVREGGGERGCERGRERERERGREGERESEVGISVEETRPCFLLMLSPR